MNINKTLRVVPILFGIVILTVSGCGGSPEAVTEPVQPSVITNTSEVPTANPTETPVAERVIDSKPEPTLTPPLSPSSAEPISVYQDELAPGWREWSWDITADYQNTSPVYADQRSIAIIPAQTWAGWGAWHDDGVDTSPYTFLNLVIQATVDNEWYVVYLLSQSGEVLSDDGYPLNPPVNSWGEYQIPLSDLGAAYKQVYGVRIMNTESTLGTYYLDEIYFGGNAPPPTPVPTAVPQTIQLSVDAGRPVHPFSNQMLGVALVNWEHSWGKYFPADVPNLGEVFKSAKVGIIRYAGGLWANWVGWERTPQRDPYTEWQPDTANYAPEFGPKVKTNHTYAFHYGQTEIDNLGLFSQQTGAEIMIQVNISQDDPYMWADLLHYANVENDYGFKYWELGNEIDLETSQGKESGMDADTYQQRVRTYAEVLRSVDPSIVIVGGVPAAGHDIVGSNWTEGISDMSRYLKAAISAGADSLSYHWYQNCNGAGNPDAVTVWEYPLVPGEDGIADPYQGWRHMYSRVWSRIGPERVQNELIPPGSLMTQGITELNYDACDHGTAPQNSNHLNAVWMADILGRLAYNGLDYLTWYTGYGNQGQGYPMIFSTEDHYPETVYLRPSYYTLFLYANYFGDQMVTSESGKEADISIWASTDSDDPGVLKLVITNISNSLIQAEIDIAGFSAVSGTKFTLSNPNPLDMSNKSNSQDHGTTINGVTLDAASISKATDTITGFPVTIEGGGLVETFPPFTVTIIQLVAGD